MPNIDPYVLGGHFYDLEGLTRDMVGILLSNHVGEQNAVSHQELCHYYYPLILLVWRKSS